MSSLGSCCGCFGGLFHAPSKQPTEAREILVSGTVVSEKKPCGNDVVKQAAQMRNCLREDVRRHFSRTCPLTEWEETWMTDEILGIYVRARETPAERLRILVPALQWRMSNQEALKSCICPYCVEKPQSHDARLFGFDKEGDFVFMNCFELPRDISVESVTRHMTCLMERALKEYPFLQDAPLEDDGHPRIRRWTFIFDLYGFGLRYYDPRVTLRLLELFQVAYRSRVKKLMVLDAPKIFWGFFKMVQPFMRPVTKEKLQFSDWKTIRPYMEKDFGNGLATELFGEAMENRDPKRVASKVWTTFYGTSLHQARTSKQIAAPEYRQDVVEVEAQGGHEAIIQLKENTSAKRAVNGVSDRWCCLGPCKGVC
jgi:hypothetical protein